jgi:hypothetical protein
VRKGAKVSSRACAEPSAAGRFLKPTGQPREAGGRISCKNDGPVVHATQT